MPKYVVNPRGSVRLLDDSEAKRVLQIPGWVEITNPSDQKAGYLPQYDRGVSYQSGVVHFPGEYKEITMHSFKTRIV